MSCDKVIIARYSVEMRFKVPKGLTEEELKEKIAKGNLFVKWGVLHYYKDKDDEEGIEIQPHIDESQEGERFKWPSEDLEIADKEEWDRSEDEEEDDDARVVETKTTRPGTGVLVGLVVEKEEEEEAECESCGSHTDVKPHLYGSLSMAVCPKCA